jgi:hypothetical protein
MLLVDRQAGQCTRDPGVKSCDLDAIQRYQIGAVTRRQSAEAIVETEELRRIPPHRKKKSRETAESLIWIRDYYRAPVVK